MYKCTSVIAFINSIQVKSSPDSLWNCAQRDCVLVMSCENPNTNPRWLRLHELIYYTISFVQNEFVLLSGFFLCVSLSYSQSTQWIVLWMWSSQQVSILSVHFSFLIYWNWRIIQNSCSVRSCLSLSWLPWLLSIFIASFGSHKTTNQLKFSSDWILVDINLIKYIDIRISCVPRAACQQIEHSYNRNLSRECFCSHHRWTNPFYDNCC